MFIAALMFLFQSFLPSTPTERAPAPNIVRFEEIAPGLFRGGQPEREGFEYLKKKGVKTVINLRTENDEEPIVKKLGMNYVHIPISLRVWAGIPEPAIEQYFKVLNDPASYPIFFHCKRGADRTGAMASFYRIAVQKWDPKKAYDEARDLGMRWWYPALKQEIYTYGTGLALPRSNP